MHAARRPGPTREVLTLLDRNGERTILPIGERLQPEGDDSLDWDRLADADGVYVTAGDQGALRRARAARVLVATPRAARARGRIRACRSTRWCSAPPMRTR